MTQPSVPRTDGVRAATHGLLALAAVAIGFAAADTYVVVLALPDMMSAAGLDVDQLQRAAPIVSGFLLGYVAVLPLIGRIADVRGRLPVLTGCLVVFAVGSVVTAAAYDLESMVAGRFVQGLGGGGLIPPTLALVADAWPPERRGLPLGVVGAVQELGSVLGPLYGAVVLAVGDWRDIFWLNAAVGALIGAAMLRLRTGDVESPAAEEPGGPPARGRPDLLGMLLAVVAVVVLVVVMLEPASLTRGITSGLAFIPVTGDSRWLTPLALSLYGVVALFVLRQLTARRPLVAMRAWPDVARQIDLLGAALLAVALGTVIVSFASADPEQHAISEDAPWLLAIGAAALAGFVVRQRTARDPLVPRGALTARPAWGAVVVSFLIGGSLIAALVDIPLFARLTVYRDSQLDAALVLVRFLVALPIGAIVGGWLLRRVAPAPLTAVAMLLSAAAFWHMSTWDRTSLESPVETLSLVAGGLGFGLAIAPVNAALLDHTRDAVHGIASALLVVARMVGMLIGISALTTLGLRSFYAEAGDIGSPADVCGGTTRCRAYDDLVLDAGIAQLHTVFTAAAVLALVAGLLALVLLRRAPQVTESP
ncbi:MFS transporter [Aeromicrobium sp. Leaf350]|uniref:MFS transporter n=1 Tax=Aeromicrobium sp. Leaf350 TaxID=2876565 RepID=UPI001E4527AF|nr:MFS transporter [Aeromicrobium sp. Leaf350]